MPLCRRISTATHSQNADSSAMVTSTISPVAWLSSAGDRMKTGHHLKYRPLGALGRADERTRRSAGPPRKAVASDPQ